MNNLDINITCRDQGLQKHMVMLYFPCSLLPNNSWRCSWKEQCSVVLLTGKIETMVRLLVCCAEFADFTNNFPEKLPRSKPL